MMRGRIGEAAALMAVAALLGSAKGGLPPIETARQRLRERAREVRALQASGIYIIDTGYVEPRGTTTTTNADMRAPFVDQAAGGPPPRPDPIAMEYRTDRERRKAEAWAKRQPKGVQA